MSPNFIFPDWPSPPNIKAATTTRQAGNLALDSDPLIVQLNQKKLMQWLHLLTPPVWLKQTHGNRVVSLNQTNTSTPIADAAYSNLPQQVCAVLTADCLPILITNTKGCEVAAIHAGWRGLAAGIINRTFATFQAPAKDLLVWLGPAIGPRAFEVGDDVRQDFLKRHTDYQKAFTAYKNRWLANIYQLAKINLNHLGVYQIFGGQFCTYSDDNLFYSYRRDKGKTGRMVTLIWINT